MNKRAKSNTIRIIAGHWRGRRLAVPDSPGLRPTTDRVRETVFNWLMHDIAGADCLDLFAGTGALGVECLSRGAKQVQFVESDKKVSEALRTNLRTLDGFERASIKNENGLSFLNSTPSGSFDLVFLDPPFRSNLLNEAIALLCQRAWLSERALVYIEQPSSEARAEVPANWRVHREGKAGQSRFSLYAV